MVIAFDMPLCSGQCLLYAKFMDFEYVHRSIRSTAVISAKTDT